MPYDNSSLNNFVQRQGGSLSSLGASPTYTGAPAMRPGQPAGQAMGGQTASQGGQTMGQGMPMMQPNPGMPMQRGNLQRLGMPQGPQGQSPMPGQRQMPGQGRAQVQRPDPGMMRRLQMLQQNRGSQGAMGPQRGVQGNMMQPGRPYR